MRDGSARLRVGETDLVVDGEIVDSLWEEDFTTLEDQHVISELREQLKGLGLDPEQAESIVKSSQRGSMIRKEPPGAFPVQPHLEWKEARKRLDEQVKRTAKILLNNVDLDIAGKEIPFKYKTLGINTLATDLLSIGIAASGETTLVVEDDAQFLNDFAARLNHVWEDLSEARSREDGFDLLYLSYRAVESGIRKITCSKSLIRIISGVWWLSGYVMTPEGASRLRPNLSDSAFMAAIDDV